MRIMEIATVPEAGYCVECDEPAMTVGMRFKGWPYKILLCKKCVDAVAKKFNSAETNGAKGNQ